MLGNLYGDDYIFFTMRAFHQKGSVAVHLICLHVFYQKTAAVFAMD